MYQLLCRNQITRVYAQQLNVLMRYKYNTNKNSYSAIIRQKQVRGAGKYGKLLGLG